MFLDSGRKMVRDTWVSPNSNTPMDKKWTGKTIFEILVRSAMEAQAEWQNPERMSRKDRKVGPGEGAALVGHSRRAERALPAGAGEGVEHMAQVRGRPHPQP